MAKAVYIQIFIGDWIRDTRALSPGARGIYTELKLHLKMQPVEGVMECVITELEQLLGFRYDFVRPLLDEIFLKKVLTCENIGSGKWRITDEDMKSAAAKSAAKSRAGKEGMKKRYGKNEIPFAPSVITNAVTPVITYNGIDNNSDSEVENNEGGAGGNGEIKMPFEGDDFKSKWQVWKAYKWEQHHWRYGYQQEIHTLEQLWRLADGKKEVAIGLISNSISKGWKNIGNYDAGSSNTNSGAGAKTNAGNTGKRGATIDELENLKRGGAGAGDERTEFTEAEVVK